MSKRKRKISPAPHTEVKSDTSSQRLNTALGVILLLVAAAIIRDIYLLQYRAALPFYNQPALDAEYYDLWAQRVASGGGYGPMPFYMAPLYPYFLALIYKLAGHSFPIAYAIQQGLGILNLLLIYVLGKRIFGHVPALVAVGLMILYGPVMYLESKLLSETLGITLALASLLLMVRALDRPTVLHFMLAGIVLGLCALCRPSVLLLVALVLVWLVMRRKALQDRGFKPMHIAVLAFGIALAISPVTIRNYTVGKGFALISTNGGIVFAQGNNAHSVGVEMPMPGFSTAITSQQAEEMHIASQALGHPVNPVESSSYWLHQGLKFIRENPGQSALLLGRKLAWSLHCRETGSSYNINFERQFVPMLRFLIMPFAVFAGFGLYGFVRDRRNGIRPETELLALQVCSVFLGLVIFSVSSRYRVPAIPALSILAGFGIMQFVELIRTRQFARIATAAAWIAPVFLISLIPYPIPAVMSSEPGNLGVAYMAAGDMDKAITYLGEALETSPNSSLAHLNMGLALSRIGKLNEAIDHYRKGVTISPGDERLHFELANALLMADHPEESIPEYKKALEANPNSATIHVCLGAAYSALDKMKEAEDEFRQSIHLQSDMAIAHYDLAWCLYSQGKYAEAWSEVHLSVKYGWKPDPRFIKDLKQKMPDPGE